MGRVLIAFALSVGLSCQMTEAATTHISDHLTAGINDEADGLFGAIVPNQQSREQSSRG